MKAAKHAFGRTGLIVLDEDIGDAGGSIAWLLKRLAEKPPPVAKARRLDNKETGKAGLLGAQQRRYSAACRKSGAGADAALLPKRRT
jgi:hypothetical protein